MAEMTSPAGINRIQAQLRASAALQERMAQHAAPAILTAADLVTAAFRSGNKMLLCGNGGSAADCQHVAAELVSRLTKGLDRPGLPAIALTTDTSFLTAHANDFGFEGIFERQVLALGRANDVLVAISTSGNSANVVRAVRAARQLNVRTIGLLGEGGQLTELVDCAIVVPSQDTQRVQEVLLCIEHILCELTERTLFAERMPRS